MSRTAPTPPLHLPYPGAPAGEAITRFFRKYATFSGRASRAEYWWIILATLIVNLLLRWADGSLSRYTFTTSPFSTGTDFATPWVTGLSILIALVTLIPGLALIWRRLHDVGRSGTWFLIILIPIAGWVVLMIWFLMPGRVEGERFDTPPVE